MKLTAWRAALVAAVAASLSTPASAAPAQPRPGLLQLVEQSGFVPPNGDFTLRVRAPGAPPGSELVVELHDRVRSRSEFVRSLTGEGLRNRLGAAGAARLADLPQDASGTVVRTIGTRAGTGPAERVRLSSQGVYPVVVDLLAADGARIDRLVTYLVRLPDEADDAPPLSVALALSFHGPPSLQPDGTVAVDPESRAGLVATAAALLNHPGVALTFTPTPETLAGLAAGADPDDAALLTTLRTALGRRQVPAVPFVDLDVSAWVAAGLEEPLAQQFDRGTQILREQLGAADSTTWVADPSLDQASLRGLWDRGVRRVVVPEDALAALDPDDFPVALAQTFEIDGVPNVRAAVADAGLAAHIGASADPVLDAHHLLADLAVLFFDEPSAVRGAVVLPPETWTPVPEFLDALLVGLEQAGDILHPVDLARYFADVPRSSTEGGELDDDEDPLVRALVPAPAAGLGSLPRQVEDAQAALEIYSQVVGRSNPHPARLAELVLVAGSRDLNAGRRTAYFDAVTEGIDAELAKIDPPPRQTITLTSRDGQLPLVFRNGTGSPVTVEVHLEAPKLEFPEAPDGVLRLELIEETSRVEVEVKALTSGDSPLDVVVTAPGGQREIGRSRYTIRSTAVSGVGVVLSVGAGAFLILWWARNIRTTRRNRRLVQLDRDKSDRDKSDRGQPDPAQT